ncbi:MAG: hypothetical protein IJP31_12735 [Lachnospiraceae bacterium]|nr:hypothetical protein [Lachnospiraceae bacterium]
MDFIIEFFLELVAGIFIELPGEIATERKYPLKWRIAAGLLPTLVFVLVLALCITAWWTGEKSSERIVFGGLAILMAVLLLWFWYKILKHKKRD